ncbi:MAG: PAS domain S-box protein, partial [Methanoregulaceae archaeon]
MNMGSDTKTKTDLPYSYQEAEPGSDTDSPDKRLSRNLTVAFGLLAVLSAVVGLIGVRSGITIISTVYLGYKTIALSAALIWILTGLVLAVHAIRPLREIPAFVVKLILAAIVIFEAIELPLNILGSHSPVEFWLTEAGRSTLDPSSSATSPIASVLIILTSISLFFLIRKNGMSGKKYRIPDAVGVTGMLVSLAGFTFVLSYVFGDPLLYGTQFIPIAALSALAAFFAGAGLITAAGPAAVPLRYVTGNSTRALLLRIFVPLTICIVIVQQILFSWISAGHLMHKAIVLAGSLVLFAIATGYIVSRVSGSLGGALDRSEAALVQRNEELHALNEELRATEEELRQNLDELGITGEALRESERRLARSQEIAHFGSWELDLLNNRLSWSDEVYRIFGLAPQEFDATYDAFLAAVSPEDRAAVDAAYSGSIREGRDSYEIEHRIVRGDNSEIRYVHEKCEHIRDPNGAVIRSVGMVHDITERWQAKEALRLAKEDLEIRVWERTAELTRAFELLGTERHRLYDVLETLPVYICLLDKDYRMPFANKYFREAFGEANGRRCYEALFSRTEPCEICETYTVMKTRAPHQWLWTGPNGRDYEVHDFPFSDADGTFMILEMGIDITERKRAEEKWAILASIVEHSEDAIIGKSLDGIIMSWNSGAEKIYGYSAEETIGRHISMLVSSGKKEHLEHILDLIRKGEPVIHYDTVRVRKDLREIEVSLTISPIKDRKGTVIGASTIARDISERKKYEKMIENANAYNRSLIEASLDPLVTINPDGSISDVNEATIRVTGFSRAELVGTDFLDYFTEPAKAKAGYEKVFRDGSVTDYALEIRHRDGSVTPVLYNA